MNSDNQQTELESFTIQEYSLDSFAFKIEEYVLKGLEVSKYNEGYPLQIGSVYTCIMNPPQHILYASSDEPQSVQQSIQDSIQESTNPEETSFVEPENQAFLSIQKGIQEAIQDGLQEQLTEPFDPMKEAIKKTLELEAKQKGKKK